jgi:hypothetical protein
MYNLRERKGVKEVEREGSISEVEGDYSGETLSSEDSIEDEECSEYEETEAGVSELTAPSMGPGDGGNGEGGGEDRGSKEAGRVPVVVVGPFPIPPAKMKSRPRGHPSGPPSEPSDPSIESSLTSKSKSTSTSSGASSGTTEGGSESSKTQLKFGRILQAMVNAYPLEPTKVPTMAELLREMMMGHYGLVMCDTVGGLFSVKIHGKNLKTGTVMEASRIRGGFGRRSLNACGIKDNVQHVFCRSRLEWPMFMKEMRALLRDTDHKAHRTVEQLSNLDEHLHLFEEGVSRWIEIIMGDAVSATQQFHVTDWAVLQYFIVVTWNRALLVLNLNARWQA